MVDAIQPQHLSLIDLLNKRLFTIPGYQRSYSWSKRQCEDLFNDILSLREEGDDASHFMATVVCLRRGEVRLGTDVMKKLDIVDGQQRLTTLVILFNAIRFALDENDEDQKRSADELGDLLVKPQGDNLLLLQTNHDSSHFFANYLRRGTAPSPDKAKTLADRNLLSAILECKNFVNKWIEEETLLDLAALIKNGLTFILHEVSEEKTVYTVFEVLNSRGIEVAWIDRLKSILMGMAFSLEDETRERLIEELHRIWREIYKVIGLRQGLNTEALRFAATLHATNRPSKPLSEQDAVDGLRNQAEREGAKSIREVAHWLLEITEACHAVRSNPRQNAVTRITQARLLAVALHAAGFDDHEKHRLLEVWEKVSFRIYGLHAMDARYEVGAYCRLAWDVANDKVSAEESRKSILKIGSVFTIEDGITNLCGQDCYTNWTDELRYFLFRYEEHLAQKRGQEVDNNHWKEVWEERADLSIEHIRPQNKAPDSMKHTLGNLMLLPPKRNSQLRDRSPHLKADSYRETGFLHAGEVADMLRETPRWPKKACMERERKLLDWASMEWADSGR